MQILDIEKNNSMLRREIQANTINLLSLSFLIKTQQKYLQENLLSSTFSLKKVPTTPIVTPHHHPIQKETTGSSSWSRGTGIVPLHKTPSTNVTFG